MVSLDEYVVVLFLNKTFLLRCLLCLKMTVKVQIIPVLVLALLEAERRGAYVMQYSASVLITGGNLLLVLQQGQSPLRVGLLCAERRYFQRLTFTGLSHIREYKP